MEIGIERMSDRLGMLPAPLHQAVSEAIERLVSGGNVGVADQGQVAGYLPRRGSVENPWVVEGALKERHQTLEAVVPVDVAVAASLVTQLFHGANQFALNTGSSRTSP